MSRTRPSSLSRTNSALRSSSAIAVIRSFAALNSASSRSTFSPAVRLRNISRPPPALGYRVGTSLWEASAFFTGGRRECLAPCTSLLLRLLSRFVHFLLYLLLGFLSFPL